MSHPDLFTTGIRVLMLIDRGVGNSNKGSRRWVSKLISTCTEEFKDNYDKLTKQQDYLANPDIRMYGCINSRKNIPAIRDFQIRQLQLATDEERRFFYKDLNNQYVSCLMKPENRAEKYYLIDVDEDSPAWSSEIYQTIHAIHKYKTPNGWHYICNPFDVRIFAGIPHVEVKKDGLMIWRTI